MSIKIIRAKHLAETGRYLQTWEAIVGAMPDELKERCTASEIAMIADAMRQQYSLGREKNHEN